jgi:signal transduction histidine kinase
MSENKFFDKILENLSRLDDAKIKSLMESLESEKRIYRDAMEYSDEALIIINENRIFFINQKAKRLLVTPNVIKLPANPNDLKKQVGNQGLFAFILEAVGMEDFKKEFTDSTRETRYYFVERITVSESIFIIKIKDITENKQMEFQLKNLESVSALNTLAAGIAHEIKNPLTAIDLHTQILKKGINKKIIEVPPEVVQYVNIIDEEQRRLGLIVNDFLTAARKRDLKMTFENINQYLKDILFLIKPEIEKNEITLSEEYEDVPKIFIDRDYLKQAIINLLKNAIESMKAQIPGSGETAKKRLLTIRTFYDNSIDSVGISITDNGVGIESEKIKKIFEPYYSTKDYGTGLGLTIVYKIIQEHGGNIKVESKKGEGSDFTIFLPLSKGTKLIS